MDVGCGDGRVADVTMDHHQDGACTCSKCVEKPISKCTTTTHVHHTWVLHGRTIVHIVKYNGPIVTKSPIISNREKRADAADTSVFCYFSLILC